VDGSWRQTFFVTRKIITYFGNIIRSDKHLLNVLASSPLKFQREMFAIAVIIIIIIIIIIEIGA
jgi:hypothetical protein